MILLISDEPALLFTRAVILSEWGCTAASIADAAGALRAGAFDLMVLCQTVPESVAVELLTLARTRNADVKVLTILSAGCTFSRAYDSATYTVNLNEPGRLRDAVANVLKMHSTAGRPSLILVPGSRRDGETPNASERQ